MTTTTSASASGSQTRLQSPAYWPARIALFDHDGRLLSEAEALEQAAGGHVVLVEIARPNALLDYYFGKSGRRLMVDLGDLLVDGWLETRWDGSKRCWWVEPGEH